VAVVGVEVEDGEDVECGYRERDRGVEERIVEFGVDAEGGAEGEFCCWWGEDLRKIRG